MIQTDTFLLLHVAYAFVSQEEAIPELEIDVDELLDMEDDVDRAARVKVSLSRITDSVSYYNFYYIFSFEQIFMTLFFSYCPTGTAGRLL